MSLKAKIEAVLYLTDKPLRAQAIAGIVGEELQTVRQALLDLIHEYEERQGGLEIADEDGYSFQVKDQYSNLMDEFLPIEMSAAQLRTLSAIAIKQPIAQSEIIRIRGAGAYDHIKELVLRGLISKREDEKARSPMLSTTKQFQEYFRLTKDGKSLRSYLKREMKKRDKADELTTAAEGAPAEFSAAPDAPAANDLSFAPDEILNMDPAADNVYPAEEPSAPIIVEMESTVEPVTEEAEPSVPASVEEIVAQSPVELVETKIEAEESVAPIEPVAIDTNFGSLPSLEISLDSASAHEASVASTSSSKYEIDEERLLAQEALALDNGDSQSDNS